MKSLISYAIALMLFSSSFGGEFNKKLSLGDVAPEWKNLPGVDGKSHSLSDLKDKEVVVVVFTCNSCPIAEDYEDRLISFAQKHAEKESKIALVAINVNTGADDKLEKMKVRAEKKKFSFPYLYDESQKIAKEYGASYTPEFFVLDTHRKVVYMGAMDDKTKAADVKVNYLDPAVESALKGDKPKSGETLARGCMIKFKRERD